MTASQAHRIVVAESIRHRLRGLDQPAPLGEGHLAVLRLDLRGMALPEVAANDAGDADIEASSRDALCEAVGARIRRRLRGSDIVLTPSRGDITILARVCGAEEARHLGKRLLRLLQRPFSVTAGGERSAVSLSAGSAGIGIAMAPDHGFDPAVLLACADRALHESLQAGGGLTLYTRDLDKLPLAARVIGQDQLTRDLAAAIAQPACDSGNGLALYYQPIFETGSRRLAAREALLRWHHPVLGMVSPDRMIPVAEASGLIVPLGGWVLRKACLDAMRWNDDVRVAVNASPAQLGRNGRLLDDVRVALAESGLPARRLEIEITESALMGASDSVVDELLQLRALGVSLALDDFGTGCSSLAHLRLLRFDRIKIDGTFVRGAVERNDCAAIVNAVSVLARNLGTLCVAEGVETEDQLAAVGLHGCAEVQGFLLGRPMPGVGILAADIRARSLRAAC